MRLELSGYKPIVSGKNGVDFLLDTGADIPVWTKPLDTFLNKYPSANIVRGKKYRIHGFGGYKDSVVYKIPYFVLADENDGFAFTDLEVAICSMNSPCHMILSYPMIRSMGLVFGYNYVESTVQSIQQIPTNTFSAVSICYQNTINLTDTPSTLRSIVALAGDHELEELLKKAGYNNQLSTFLRVFPDGATDLSNAQILDKFKETIPQSTSYARGELV